MKKTPAGMNGAQILQAGTGPDNDGTTDGNPQ